MREQRDRRAGGAGDRHPDGGSFVRLLPVVVCLVALAGCSDSTAPPPVTPPPTLPVFTAVTAGATHTCAMTAAAELYCWGRGGAGALGTDSVVSFTVPTLVLSAGFTFSGVNAGTEHTCAVTPAGEAYCWGQNDHGQLGNGRKTSSRTPVLVATAQRFASIVAGADHSCAVTASGSVYCWGRNADAELGQRRTGPDSAAPGAPVSDTSTYVRVTNGLHHSCGVTGDGRIRCWGWNAFGQLGVDARVSLGAPENVHGNRSYKAVSAGSDFTCGVTPSNQVFCWGRNDFGQLGNGTTVDTAGPVAVSGGVPLATVSAGGTHACGLTADGQAYCWGNNSDGQLGSGAAGGVQPAPVAVATTVRFSQISSGGLHTCAVTAAGAVYCWGFGGFGQLGTGRAISSATPAAAVPGS